MNNDGEKYLTEADIIEWQRAKRADWMRDKQLIAEGKLRPEDLMAVSSIPFEGGVRFDLTGVKASLDWDEEFDYIND